MKTALCEECKYLKETHPHNIVHKCPLKDGKQTVVYPHQVEENSKHLSHQVREQKSRNIVSFYKSYDYNARVKIKLLPEVDIVPT